MIDLFSEDSISSKPQSIGNVRVEYKKTSGILTQTSGFMRNFDYTLNPYSGCSFGCSYCYAAFFQREEERIATWGEWVSVKENALELLKRKRKKTLDGALIYMSSVTDPYQPIEKKLELTRSLLKELLDYHNVKLVVQTRSPLVARDVDLLKKFPKVQVNMTVTTNDDTVRKAFEPGCSAISARLKAIHTVMIAGIPACITMTPLLPVTDVDGFIRELLATGVQKFVIQPFHAERGRFIAGTRDVAMSIIEKYDWTHIRYKEVEQELKQALPNTGIGRDGFSL